MKTARREQRIIGLLESRGEISVNELSEILDISVSTLRKQLAVMQQNGLLIRTYGGVMSVAERARALVPSGASIALGSGTTVYDLCNLLDDLDRGVIYSNSMQASDYLARVNGLEVHICSGIVRSLTGSIIGNEVAEYFRSLKQVDYAFIGCDAINANGEVMSDNVSVATAEQNILFSAKHRYILCDSSKIGQSAVAHITSLKNCDGLITGYTGSEITERYKTLTEVLYV